MARFSDEELRRYGRQMVLAEVGGHGQERLRAAHATARGELEALYLAAAGVGFLTVGSEMIAEAARALNPLVRVTVDEAAAAEEPSALAGALAAVDRLKQVLEL